MVVEHKTCPVCGRRFEWQKRWRNNWDAVRFCSAACRSRRHDSQGLQLEQEILATLQARAAGVSVCPSEIARAVSGNDNWKALMEPVRRAARRLAQRGELEITQRGAVVDPATMRGPVRLRLPAGTA